MCHHGIAICEHFSEHFGTLCTEHCVENSQSLIKIKTDQISVQIFPYPNAYRFIVDNTVGSVSGVNSRHTYRVSLGGGGGGGTHCTSLSRLTFILAVTPPEDLNVLWTTGYILER